LLLLLAAGHSDRTVSDTQFTVAGDLTGIFKPGTPLRWDSATKFGYVWKSAHAAGTTTVDLVPNADYVMPAGITSVDWSRSSSPPGHPVWLNWAPNHSGWSANPTSTVYQLRCDGPDIICVIRQSGAGTSNNATHTVTAPVAAKTVSNGAWWTAGLYQDNGTNQMGSAFILSAGTTISLTNGAGTNTASGASRMYGCLLRYPMAVS
jgi:hypothetical protein